MLRENCFLLTLTDKEVNSTRYAIIETCAAPIDNDADPDPDSRPVTFAIISPHPFYNKYKKLINFLKSKYFKNFTEFELAAKSILNVPEPDTDGKQLIKVKLSSHNLVPNLVPIPTEHVSFQYTDKTKMPYTDFSCSLPLNLLGPENFIKVVILLMLEHKIVVVSRNLSALTQSVEAFVSCLYPLEFLFCVIPLLPQQLQGARNILNAPTPFIIGVTHSLLNQYKLPGDAYLVDLDASSISTKFEENPEIPMPPKHCIEEFLKEISDLNSTGRDSEEKENNTESSDIVRIASTKFICSILAGVNAHTRILRLYPRSLVSVNLRTWLCGIKRDSIRQQAFPFFSDLIKTHAVEYFAEKSLKPDNVAFIRIELGESEPKSLCGQEDYEKVLVYDVETGEVREEMDELNEDASGAACNGATRPSTSELDVSQAEGQAQDTNQSPIKKRMTEEEIRSMVVVSVGSVTSPGAIQANSLFRQLSDERFLRKPRNLEALENQNYLKDVITQVLNGDMMTWFSGKTLANLLVDESYRLYILSNLNSQTQSNNNNEYLEHIEIDKQVYNNMLIILRICLSGLSRVFDNGRLMTAGSGGLASAIWVLGE